MCERSFNNEIWDDPSLFLVGGRCGTQEPIMCKQWNIQSKGSSQDSLTGATPMNFVMASIAIESFYPTYFFKHCWWGLNPCRSVRHLTAWTTMDLSLPNGKRSEGRGMLRDNQINGWLWCIFTIRNSSCGKVMFSQPCVILFTWGVHPPGQTPPSGQSPLGRHTPPRQTPPPWQTPPLPSRDAYCSGWYASYWNTFLLRCILLSSMMAETTVNYGSYLLWHRGVQMTLDFILKATYLYRQIEDTSMF